MGELAAENNCQNKFIEKEETKVSLPEEKRKGKLFGGGALNEFVGRQQPPLISRIGSAATPLLHQTPTPLSHYTNTSDQRY